MKGMHHTSPPPPSKALAGERRHDRLDAELAHITTAQAGLLTELEQLGAETSPTAQAYCERIRTRRAAHTRTQAQLDELAAATTTPARASPRLTNCTSSPPSYTAHQRLSRVRCVGLGFTVQVRPGPRPDSGHHGDRDVQPERRRHDNSCQEELTLPAVRVAGKGTVQEPDLAERNIGRIFALVLLTTPRPGRQACSARSGVRLLRGRDLR